MHPSLLLGGKTHQDLVSLLAKTGQLTISGASNETAKALLMSTVFHGSPQPTLLLTEQETTAEALQHWLHFFGVEAKQMPRISAEGEITAEVLRAFLLFAGTQTPSVTILTRQHWDAQFPQIAELAGQRLVLRTGEAIDFAELIERLLDQGYTHAEETVLEPGEYRRVGDTLDIFPIQAPQALRISIPFDVVEQIRPIVDAAGTLGPAEHDAAIYPFHYSRTASISDQMPVGTLLMSDDEDDVPKPKHASHLAFTPFPEGAVNHAHLRYLSILKFYTLTDFLNDIRDKINQDWRLMVVTKRAEELEGICDEEHIPHTRDAKKGGASMVLVPADQDDLLPHSLQNPDLKIALLTDREIFSLRKAGKQRSVQKLALDFITSLTPGDYVVHMEHGIGHFEGMTQREFDGTMREYLELTYAENDKLFVPVDQADKLSKYVYEEGNEPQLMRLGTNDWKKLTSKLKEETERVAKELLQLYAKRAAAKGHSYPPDAGEMKQFEDAFPYQETPGQAKAIEDIKKDMEDSHPMDRLVCGDVGFGKTEVAMRAAFKAAKAGKQVAVVAPITILAEQHYESFVERMKGFHLRIEALSRFRTAKEQKEIIERLRKGDIDIVIGTHRLLQDDVKFHNLGLVVVDEEQRFGVKQKEKFKEMRANVDVLTMTATPIPRTLNLGLHKLRDISTITTPPPGRLPIITEVRKFSDSLLKQAIEAELKREGQVYVLHNRVETIDAFAGKVKGLVPKARVVVGHGQLKPEDLETRIGAFKRGEYDVLVSSTIIENGIDLPRANTLVVNEAERFGLAQLYQLRGRVGRGKVQAYAYFLYHSQKLQDDAKKRLRAIVEACELGSGFQVAMRDLEIRGAGEILGSEQSGTMQTVGVSHYLRMLKSAVEELKTGEGGEPLEEATVELQLPFEALLPTYYIPDQEEKISVYQKLAGSETEEILQEFAGDLRDEYGELPKPVRTLFAVLRLKLACKRSHVIRVKMEHMNSGREVILTLSPHVTAEEVMQLLQKNPLWRIAGSQLKLKEEQLLNGKAVSEEAWIDALTEQIAALEHKKKKKEKKEAAKEE